MRRTIDLKILLICIAPILSICLIALQPNNLSVLYKENWLCLCLCFSFCTFILAMMYLHSYIDIFSPVTVVSAIYLLMFYLVPLYDIAIGETSIFGVDDLFYYGVKSTVVATIGFLSYTIAYTVRVKKIKPFFDTNVSRLSKQSQDNIVQISLLGWCVAFAIEVVINIITNGFSITYILTLGLLGNGSANATSEASLDFISQATRSIISFYLIYFCTSQSKPIKALLFVLTVAIITISGFRYMIVVFICSFVFLNYLIKKKKPSATTLVGVIVILAVLSGAIGATREAIRAGEGANLSGLDSELISETALDNFRIYKSYYGVVKAVPRLTPYIYGKQIIEYTLIMIIPRAIWPGKPGNPGTLAQLYGMNQAAVSSGYAYPCLGEYYYGFGVIGVIIFMGIIGLWLAQISNRYRSNAQSNLDLARFCVISAAMFQIITRGYTPSNFYFIIALTFPFVIVKRFERKE